MAACFGKELCLGQDPSDSLLPLREPPAAKNLDAVCLSHTTVRDRIRWCVLGKHGPTLETIMEKILQNLQKSWK